MERLAFLACVERGSLEAETVLLCRSIRQFAGRDRCAPIHTFQPRPGTEITAETLDALGRLDVTHHALPLNTELPHYGAGNKVFVAAWAEENIEADVLVFVDSDTVMVAQPSALALAPGVVAAVRVADSAPLNSTGPGHPLEAYWHSVHDELGLAPAPFIVTELGRRVRAYFSAGLVAVRRDAGLFGRWRANLRALVGAGLFPPGSGIGRMDEVALVATLVPHFGRVCLLDDRYNYLIYRRARLRTPWREAQLDQLIHIHYRDSFADEHFLDRLEPPLRPDCPIKAWLEQHLPLGPSRARRRAAAGEWQGPVGR